MTDQTDDPTVESKSSASARRSWQENVDAEGYTLSDLGTLATRDNPTEIRDFEGDGLQIDSGKLHASGIADLSASLTQEVPGERSGQLTIEDTKHTLQVSGTRRPSWMIRPFQEPIETNSTSYTKVGNELNLSLGPFPPGYAPILRIVGHFNNDPRYSTHLRVSVSRDVNKKDELENSDDRQTILELAGQGRSQVFDEANLDKLDNMSGAVNGSQEQRQPTQFFFEIKTEDAQHTANIESSSTIALELEALSSSTSSMSRRYSPRQRGEKQ